MLTIVLVHGAFADASSWNGVVERLQNQGHTVVAPANPLRGLADDTAYIASVVDQIEGPVLLVGHSYAGAIISNVVAKARNVVGLVFVAALAQTTANGWATLQAGRRTRSSARLCCSEAIRPEPMGDWRRVRRQPLALPRSLRRGHPG